MVNKCRGKIFQHKQIQSEKLMDCNFKDYIKREVDNLESELNNLCRIPLEDEIDVKQVIKVCKNINWEKQAV